jgi:ATP-dependent Clp protease ATP-binding subunit ClpC
MLEKNDLDKIVDLEIDKLVKRLREKDITIQLETSARDLLVQKGYDPSYGARPMRRAVERYLEDPLAEALLRGDVKPGDTAKVVCPEGKEELVFETIGTKAEPDSAGV